MASDGARDRQEGRGEAAVAEAAAVKAKVPSDPQTAKVKDAVSTNKTLPPKEPVITPVDLSSDEEIEIISLKALQDDISDFENELVSEFKRLRHLCIKYRRTFPDNITADGKRKIINDKKKKAEPPGRSTPRAFTVKGFERYYRGQVGRLRTRFKELNRRIDLRRDTILTGKTTTVISQNVGKLEDIFIELKEGPRIGPHQFGEELIENMDAAYPIAEKAFSVPI